MRYIVVRFTRNSDAARVTIHHRYKQRKPIRGHDGATFNRNTNFGSQEPVGSSRGSSVDKVLVGNKCVSLTACGLGVGPVGGVG